MDNRDTGRDTRREPRDSLFLLAKMRLAPDGEDHWVKLRNVSSSGVMAEGPARAARSQAVWVHLPSLGLIEGRIAWAAGDRCGIAFCKEIDVEMVRFPVDEVDLPADAREHLPND